MATRKVLTDGKYYCPMCKEFKAPSEFNKNPKYTNGLESECRKCRKKRYKAKYERKTVLKSKYGLTLEAFDEMVEKQNGVCAICLKSEVDVLKKRLSVDHCHKTGKVRGLLCSRCNQAIGLMKDDVSSLARAIEYLSK